MTQQQSVRFLMLFGTSCYIFELVAARFCEGGHICTLPRECCTQGCCPPPYQSGPRQLPPASEHVLNLFFISHWFFWCVVVAVILAVLCAYSLWKKRRTLCGWGFNEHHVQSEGDSAGSCYAPPQYSRCNSFHHPPPPYTEVTSKPDLYPLVFTCNSENGKNGSSYLMVQYFRNYIVRPQVGSLSAASTVDSLSSSFICNVNEANTLVPPPYSRAASPEIGYSNHFHQQYMLPRSASQLVCMNTGAGLLNSQEANLTVQQAYDQRNSLYTAVGGHLGGYDTQLLPAESYAQDNHELERQRGRQQRSTSFMQAASGAPRYMVNSNSSISDIFVNGAFNSNASTANQAETVVDMTTTIATSSPDIASLQSNASNAAGCIQTNPLHRLSRHSVSFSSHSPVHHSRHSVAGTRSLAAAESTVAINDNVRHQDIHMLRRSLESCRQLLQRQQRPATIFSSMDTAALSLHEVTDDTNREAGVAQSVINSLANIEGATNEVKEILEQIRQLQEGVSLEEICMPISRPMLQHTMSTPTPASTKRHSSAENNLQRCVTMPTEQQQQKHASTPSVTQINTPMAQSRQQPLSTYSNKKKFYTPKPNKSLYIPMVASNGQGATPNRCILKSPVSNVVGGASFFINRGRGRKVWISRSAPSTPGTCLPPNCFGDDSPLLNEHEEDQEGEQNAELEHA